MSDYHYQFNKTWRLLSMVLSALIIVSVVIPITPHAARAANIPELLYPQNYAETTPTTDPPVGVPLFTWSSVAGATLYRIQVDNDFDFSSPIINATSVNTFYTPAAVNQLLADGEWVWRVRVDKPVDEWSEPVLFTKTWATADNKPLLITPDDGDTMAFFDAPDFSWTRVIGAAKYRFQISTTPDDFAVTILSLDTLSTSIQPSTRLANGIYFWRVVPMDTADHLGTPSETRSFILSYGTGELVPELIEPSDGSHPVLTPIFRWSPVEGAEYYRLEYTSAENCDFSLGRVVIDTRLTTYTPLKTFPNDKWYCWHVRVESGPATGDWSETWKFQKQWYLQPQLLTPTNLYQTALYPLFSWTPVPGAARYYIEIANNPSFNSSVHANTSSTFYTPSSYVGTSHYYWRVTPFDGSGETGLTSDVWEFQSYYTSTAPIQVYPLYYYPPDNYGEYTMNPHEDRTVPYPVFIWHRVMNPSDEGGLYAPAYRIQVDDYPPYFSDPVWQYDTENTSAAPTGIGDDIFTPNVGQDYWWRVCPLSSVGGSCLVNPVTGLEWWSQVWQARFDSSLSLPPAPAQEPTQLLRPAHAQESVEATPLFEWWPVQGATQYQIEISRDEYFASPEISKNVTIPVYSPDYSLAQRFLGRTDYGSFYWRVRAYVSGSWGAWSDTWRFQIASQSEWRFNRSLGNPANQLLIGDDPAGDVDITTPIYDLTILHAAQSRTYWYLGFNANLTTTDTTYVFYIDLDHIDGSGAPTPPPARYYTVSTIAAHQPEYAIYVDVNAGEIDAENTWLFTWNDMTDEWSIGTQFYLIGGDVYSSTGHVELEIPNGAIGMSSETGSASISLFSVDLDTGLVKDTVPSDPQVPGSAHLSRFSSVSDHMNLIFPANTASDDPSTIPSILPFFYDWPTGNNPSTPFAGSTLQVALDPKFTNVKANAEVTSKDSYFGENQITFLNDLIGDNTYYWRVRPKYLLPGETTQFGAWTAGWSFHRFGLIATNLQTSVTSSTPTFSWDIVEGASDYILEIATDPYFDHVVAAKGTALNTYTPTTTFAPGLYYWHVQVNRYQVKGTTWSETKQFELEYEAPAGLTPDGEVVSYPPTLCWQPVVTAWLYKVQVSVSENFNPIYDTVETTNHCWTPTKGYKDGTYYWHVAIIDGSDRVGTYSANAMFTHISPATTLVTPSGGPYQFTPTFVWTPVDGAAMYRFEVSLSPLFSTLYDSAITFNTRFTPIKTYEDNHIYYWRVFIRDRSGNQSTQSASTSFVLGKGVYTLPLVLK